MWVELYALWHVACMIYWGVMTTCIAIKTECRANWIAYNLLNSHQNLLNLFDCFAYVLIGALSIGYLELWQITFVLFAYACRLNKLRLACPLCAGPGCFCCRPQIQLQISHGQLLQACREVAALRWIRTYSDWEPQFLDNRSLKASGTALSGDCVENVNVLQCYSEAEMLITPFP